MATDGDPQQWLNRLRRIERQVQALERMVGERAAISEVLAQITAVSKALRTVAVGLLTEHVRQCINRSVRSEPEAAASELRAATEAIAQLVRS